MSMKTIIISIVIIAAIAVGGAYFGGYLGETPSVEDNAGQRNAENADTN